MVKIKYLYLGGAIDFLYGLSLKGKQSRHRSRIIRLMQERLKEVSKEELELMKECAELDATGKVLTNEDGVPIVKKECNQEVAERKQELFEECMVLEGADLEEPLKTVRNLLMKYDKEVSGKTAEIYDYLYEQFEEVKNNDDKN